MPIDKELLKGSTVILVLALLDKQPMYGYQMIKEIEQRSNGTFLFKEGTLYPILHALEADGFVESFWSEQTGSRKRKYYRITEQGRSRLKQKQREWAIFRSAVDQVIGEEYV